MEVLAEVWSHVCWSDLEKKVAYVLSYVHFATSVEGCGKLQSPSGNDMSYVLDHEEGSDNDNRNLNDTYY